MFKEKAENIGHLVYGIRQARLISQCGNIIGGVVELEAHESELNLQEGYLAMDLVGVALEKERRGLPLDDDLQNRLERFRQLES